MQLYNTMAKTLKNIWDKFIAWDNILTASHKAEKGRRFYRDIAKFNYNREINLQKLIVQLESGLWQPTPYHCFTIFEPKKRIISAPAYPDRIVHHALVQVIENFLDNRFINETFACRTNKGTHAASRYLYDILYRLQHEYGDTVYVLKADISKYFDSIDHSILLNKLYKYITDKRIQEVIHRLVTFDRDKGLPLGALTSQLFANLYLNSFDHYVKEDLNISYYLRYMDDFIIIHPDKAYLQDSYVKIREYITNKLHLTLNYKTKIIKAFEGVNFTGYWHWYNHITPRKSNVKKACRMFKSLDRLYRKNKVSLEYTIPRVASFTGYIQHCDGWLSATKVFSNLKNIPTNAMPIGIKQYIYKGVH